MSEERQPQSDAGSALIRVRGLTKRYPGGTQALADVDVDVRAGEFLAVIGPSGAGKSTFMRCLNGLVRPTAGSINYAGADLAAAHGSELRRARRGIGMVFQQFNLVRRLTVLQNVLIGRCGYQPFPRSLLPIFSQSDVALALEALERVGIMEKAYERAGNLSGGQQQRVAIARALAQQPGVMLADEPVASLDPETSITVLDDLRRINREQRITTIVNLHQLDFARDYADRVIGFRRGRLVFDGLPSEVNRDIYERVYR
jgi:phosphonate transport system ATP-binding protein